jgi:hypothetical protein
VHRVASFEQVIQHVLEIHEMVPLELLDLELIDLVNLNARVLVPMEYSLVVEILDEEKVIVGA